jgi:methyltransferase
MPDISLPAVLFLGFIIIQRLGELALAKRNSARLLASGATEFGSSHYPLIVALHTLWIIALVVFGISNSISMPWLAVFLVLQILRVWILASLGERWTTRIIVLDEPLVRVGPFAFLRHPNYVLVVAEIFTAPMVLDLIWVALLFSILNAAVLTIRISVEEKALGHLRGRGA